MTREDFWMQVYMASFNYQHYGDQAISDANDALAAYDKALKEYGEARKEGVVWPEGSLPWACNEAKDKGMFTLRRYSCREDCSVVLGGNTVLGTLGASALALDWYVAP